MTNIRVVVSSVVVSIADVRFGVEFGSVDLTSTHTDFAGRSDSPRAGDVFVPKQC